MRRRIYLAALAILVAACHAEQPEPTVFFGLTEAEPWTAPTRSLLTASDIETRKTGVTLAAYADGALAAVGYYASSLEAMVLGLEPDRKYTVYALVNMGNMTSTIPLLESELNTLTYRIPSYTDGAESLASRGLPMAGKLAWPGQGTAIPVRRLVAKVTAHLSCDWDGASIQDVRVRNLNRTLRPYGDAVREEDWDQQEFHAGTGASSGTFVFYVPENRQGSIGGIKNSIDKSPDRNATVKSREDDLTYLETKVTATESAYAGEITYRSYLGGNETTDFDIQRNGRYDWTVVYHGDRTQDQDWKRDGDIFRMDISADRTEAYVGETIRLTATCFRSDHGTETVTDVTQTAVWTRVDGSSSNVRIAKGTVTATAPGTASFRAAYTQGGRTAWAESPVITFRELPPLSVLWLAKAIYVGQRGSLEIDGLADGATISEVISSDTSVATKAAISGNTVYVNFTGATGSATLTVKASNGQIGAINVTPESPSLLDIGSSYSYYSYYGHPDGTDVNTNSSGHGGSLPSFAYFAGKSAPVNRLHVGSDDSPTTTYTGKTLAPDLYDAILKPGITVSDPLRFGQADENRIWVKSLDGYPSEGGVAIGTFTASPAVPCGVQPLIQTIYSVDPFAEMLDPVSWPDFNDMEMLAQYIYCDDYHQNVRFPGTEVNATTSSLGWDVKLAGEWNAMMRERFTENGDNLYFDYTEGNALPHIGGLCEVVRTITNPYSGEKVYKTFLSFNVIVWGAIGGKVVLDSSTKFEVRPAYVGPEAARPIGKVFSTNYTHGEGVELYGPSGSEKLNGTVSRDNNGHSLDETVYNVTLSFGKIVREEQIYRSISPNLTGSYDSDPYYRIARLEDIQEKMAHPDFLTGWIIE